MIPTPVAISAGVPTNPEVWVLEDAFVEALRG
jgi:hypothetical protein